MMSKVHEQKHWTTKIRQNINSFPTIISTGLEPVEIHPCSRCDTWLRLWLGY